MVGVHHLGQILDVVAPDHDGLMEALRQIIDQEVIKVAVADDEQCVPVAGAVIPVDGPAVLLPLGELERRLIGPVSFRILQSERLQQIRSVDAAEQRHALIRKGQIVIRLRKHSVPPAPPSVDFGHQLLITDKRASP